MACGITTKAARVECILLRDTQKRQFCTLQDAIWDFSLQLPCSIFHLISANLMSLFSSEFEQNRARNRSITACLVPTVSAYNKVAACAARLGNQSNSHRSSQRATRCAPLRPNPPDYIDESPGRRTCRRIGLSSGVALTNNM